MKHVGFSGTMGCGKDTAAEIVHSLYGHVPVAFADALKRFTLALFPDLDPRPFWGSTADRNTPFETPIGTSQVARAHRRFDHSPVYDLTRKLLDGATPIATAAARFEQVMEVNLPITTPRRLLQVIGTDWGRSLHDQVWILALKRTVDGIAEGVPYFRRDGLLHQLITRLAPAHAAVTDCRFLNEAEFVAKTLGGPVFWIDASERVRVDSKQFAHVSETTMDQLVPHITAKINNNGSISGFANRLNLACVMQDMTPKPFF